MYLDFEGFTNLLSLPFGKVHLGVGLTFVNKDVNMATVNFSHFKTLNA